MKILKLIKNISFSKLSRTNSFPELDQYMLLEVVNLNEEQNKNIRKGFQILPELNFE